MSIDLSKAPIVEIDGCDLTVEKLHHVATSKIGAIRIALSKKSLKKMQKARDFVFEIVKKGDAVYGINTGFGALATKRINDEDLGQLQLNLIRSHCTGVGRIFSRNLTRAIMILRANCLASGFSGINPEIVELLLDFLNYGITPVVPQKGSVGASGDLAPLSHIALALIGEGEVEYQGKIVNSEFAIGEIGKKPAVLGPKDGLALINGTAVMTALGAFAAHEAHNMMKLADIVACMTLDGVKGTSRAYYEGITELKPHPGQIASCKNLNTILKGSEINQSHDSCNKVQDPYSLRCVPQVHGACRQTLAHTTEVITTELNAVTDNPLIFVDKKIVVSGGNFHGEAPALTMDYLAMGLSEIANICERRIEKMMNPTFSCLPPFLIESSGLNSGLMIAHVTAAALVSENKGLCHPASVDSVPTSTDKEDHVSMGPIAGRKLNSILVNVKHCLAIEILCNCQALDFQKPLKSSPAIEAVHSLIRKHVPFIDNDRVFYKDIENIVKLIDNCEIVRTVENSIGSLK